MASESKSSWGAVLCGCLPWSGQPSSPDEAVPLATVPHNDEAAPKPDEVVPKPDEVVPGPSGAAPMATTVGASDGPRTKDNASWGALKLTMEGLEGALDVFPPLKIAVGALVGSMTQLQIADENQQEYEQLALDLARLASQLQSHLPQSKPTRMPYSVENAARSIRDQARHIQQQQDRSKVRQFAAAREDDEDVIKCYRRVETLFRQLQTDISLSIWDVVREEQMETRLQRITPADDAWYDSSLAETMTKRRRCTENTRTQVLTDAQAWTRGEKEAAKIYWMNGMAGTGKTTIAYSLCERLEENKQLGASFFCSRDSPNCRDVTKIVPTVAYQLARYSNPYRQALCDALSNNPDVAKKNIDTQFKNLIVKPLEGLKEAIPRDVVVVIDALDECSDISGTKQVLDLLFQHATELPLRFFVTSRPEPGILNKMEFRDDTSRSILRLHDIAESLVQEDIRTYLKKALESIRLSDAALERLTARAGRLFIFAATAVRYIIPDNGAANSQERLQAILNTAAVKSPKQYEELDALYTTILSKALEGSTLEEYEVERRRLVLRTVVCAREPSTAATLAELLGLQGEQQVLSEIQPLRSVLHVSEGSGVVSTLHASFPDYLLSEGRSKAFYCNEAQHNEYLSARCFDVMKHSLRFNICGLETSDRFDKDVPNLQNRVDSTITSGLFYACQYWGDHLVGAGILAALQTHLNEFLQYRLLFWMEVLNLKGLIGRGEGMLSQALSWLPTDDTSTELRQFTYDARNFITTFAANPVSLSTPHIYLSVLPFTSIQSHVRTNYWPKTRGLLRVEGTGMEARGKAALAMWNVGSAVMSLAQSHDGKLVVSGSKDGTVSIWDVSKGTRTIGPLQSGESWDWDLVSGYPCYGPHLTFSRDGTRIASGSKDSMLRIWDARQGNLLTDPLASHQGPVLSIAFSPDGALLISGSEDHTIRMWDGRTGALMSKTFEGHQGGVTSIAFSSDSTRVVSGSTDNTIRVWDVHTGATIIGPLEGHSNWVNSVAFSPDGQRIASGSRDSTVRFWDAQSGLLLAGPVEGHTERVVSVAFSPDGMGVVSGSWDDTICIWNVQNGTLITGPLRGHRHDINSVLFSTDGTRLLSGSDDGTICVWDARHGTAASATSSGHTSPIYSVAFSPDGTRAVSGSGDHTIRVWDTRDGRLVVGPLEGHTSYILSVAFSPDGAQLVSGSGDHTIRTWDSHSGASIAGSFEGHTSQVWSVAYSPDGNRIVSGSADNTIRVWDSQTGKPAVEPFMGHTDSVMSVAWSPNGARIVSGSNDKTVRMWNTHDGAALWTLEGHSAAVYSVAYSPDGTRVISGSSDCTILVLNADDGTVLHGPFKSDTGDILSVAFSPDGTRIISGSLNCTVCVWDAEKGTLVSGPFKGHTELVRSVAFSPDGRRVVSCSSDCTIRFWEAATADTSHPASLNHCAIRDDGWATYSDSQLLMWLPPDLRAVFPIPPSSLVISSQGATRADYGHLLVGKRWKECYRDSETSTIP